MQALVWRQTDIRRGDSMRKEKGYSLLFIAPSKPVWWLHPCKHSHWQVACKAQILRLGLKEPQYLGSHQDAEARCLVELAGRSFLASHLQPIL
jgi:hypothetical protein